MTERRNGGILCQWEATANDKEASGQERASRSFHVGITDKTRTHVAVGQISGGGGGVDSNKIHINKTKQKAPLL
jgi:hypothetical protein